MAAWLPLVLCLAITSGLASPTEVRSALGRLGTADLVVVSDPAGARPAHVLEATRVAASVARLEQVISDPSSFRKAMPSFRRVAVTSKNVHKSGQVDLQVAWELEVPLWNLEGTLWLRAHKNAVDLILTDGDFAPGLFKLTVQPDASGKHDRAVLSIDGFANVRDANLATRKLTQHSPLAEPAITVAAVYVMLKSLARYAETGTAARPSGPMTAPDPASLDGSRLAKLASKLLGPRRPHGVVAAVRSRPHGRLLDVEVAVQLASPSYKAAARSLRPASFRTMLGWKKIEPTRDAVCKNVGDLCWKVEDDMPLFSLDGILEIRPRPWRARMVAGDCQGAVLGLDFLPGKTVARSIAVLSQHPRLDQAGYVPRKLIAAEPYLEHGLALALTLAQAVSLQPGLEKD